MRKNKEVFVWSIGVEAASSAGPEAAPASSSLISSLFSLEQDSTVFRGGYQGGQRSRSPRGPDYSIRDPIIIREKGYFQGTYKMA